MSVFKVRPVGNNIQIINPYTQPSIEPTIVYVPVEEKKKYSLRVDEDAVVDIPPGVKEIFISLVGGGGAGGLGTIKDGISFSGGGGGSGFGIREIPIRITDVSNVSIDCKIGKGGCGVTPLGGDTIVKIIVNGSENTCLTGGGGNPGGSGSKNNGGLGGYGQNTRSKGGFKGSTSIPSHPPIGGSGGASLFAAGGKGTSYHLQDLSEGNGKCGSGGGGKIPTSPYETPTKGGDGFVMVEYFE
ncbi:MAG: hypothetical protein PHG66_02045 [Candidatus Colwellbacteria bacterium]|nr:hypothetical protein [Candidatus Colwellbacteria bacterium]